MIGTHTHTDTLDQAHRDTRTQNGGRGNYANCDGNEENKEGQEVVEASRIRSSDQRGGCLHRGKGVGERVVLLLPPLLLLAKGFVSVQKKKEKKKRKEKRKGNGTCFCFLSASCICIVYRSESESILIMIYLIQIRFALSLSLAHKFNIDSLTNQIALTSRIPE